MVPLLLVAVVVAATIEVCFAQTPKGAPLIIPPSGHWDGADGPWSTFNIGVGDPAQLFRCVPGISQGIVLLPISGLSCPGTDCGEWPRYSYNESRTADMHGFYSQNWGPSLAGFDSALQRPVLLVTDNVFLGSDAVRDLGIARQWIGASYVPGEVVGFFGLGMESSLPDDDSGLTLLKMLRGNEAIPSATFSYTAGSAKLNNSGSLILGGYDTSRFNASTTIHASMPSKENITLPVQINSISLLGSNSTTWTPASSLTFLIDSVLPELWLPLEACNMFENIFGLTWNDTLQYYFVDDATHVRLLQENPSVSFSISGKPNGQAVDLTLPYSAFDLQLQPALINTTRNYFPIKRAASPRQYMLGRTFLQGTYITVDYDRASFNLSQAYSTAGTAYIVPILPPYLSNNNDTSSKPGKDSIATYVGLGVGLTAAISILIAVVWLWRRGGRLSTKGSVDLSHHGKAELDDDNQIARLEAAGNGKVELQTNEKTHEALGSVTYAELETVEKVHEVYSPRIDGLDSVHELYGSNDTRPVNTHRRFSFE